jgi:2-pyrone-4,6-dicarboxylate lactonase
MMTVPICRPPDFAPRRPKIAFPPLSCDCHAHICGPAGKYAYYPDRIYTPSDSLLPDYLRLLGTLGVERGVLVQPSFYGSDNRAMLEAIAAAGPNFRGVALVPEDIDDRALETLHAAGVRGVRVNIVDVKDRTGTLPLDRLVPLARRVRPFGWHMEFLAHVNEFSDLDRLLADFPVDVVFGHLGYVPSGAGVADPGFQALLRLMRDGRAWVKLTAPYRISAQPAPHADTMAFAQALLAAAPERLVWGTDWPHVKAQWEIPMPNDGDLADLLANWIPNAGLRHKVMVDNPARLYGFT